MMCLKLFCDIGHWFQNDREAEEAALQAIYSWNSGHALQAMGMTFPKCMDYFTQKLSIHYIC